MSEDSVYYRVEDAKVRKALVLAIARTDDALKDALGDVAGKVVDDAKRKAPKAANHKDRGKTLAQSIYYRVRANGLYIRSNKKYSAIQEFGGSTSPHEITPKKAKALAFNGIVRTKVNHPGGTIKAKHYIGDAMGENVTWIDSQIAQALEDALVRGGLNRGNHEPV